MEERWRVTGERLWIWICYLRMQRQLACIRGGHRACEAISEQRRSRPGLRSSENRLSHSKARGTLSESHTELGNAIGCRGTKGSCPLWATAVLAKGVGRHLTDPLNLGSLVDWQHAWPCRSRHPVPLPLPSLSFRDLVAMSLPMCHQDLELIQRSWSIEGQLVTRRSAKGSNQSALSATGRSIEYHVHQHVMPFTRVKVMATNCQNTIFPVNRERGKLKLIGSNVVTNCSPRTAATLDK